VLPRTPVAIAAAVAILAAGSSVAIAPPSAGARHLAAVRALPSLDTDLVARINAVRAHHGLRPLRVSVRLRAAAAAHSFEMVRRGYFAHESADGTSASGRIRHFYLRSGNSHGRVGETLLWYSPDVDAAGTVRDWLGSSDHRAILLDPAFREIGAAAVHAKAAGGMFGGSAVTLVTADFGAR
jgi:uncharacterized protein YkwD